MDPSPDFGEETYKGSGKLKGKVSRLADAFVFNSKPYTAYGYLAAVSVSRDAQIVLATLCGNISRSVA